jgi:PAS domain S-box-containing protein
MMTLGQQLQNKECHLAHTEELFRLLVASIKDYAIFLLDPDGRVSSWNLGAERITGYSQDEVLGKHFANFYPNEANERRQPEHALELALREGTYRYEGPGVRKDGSEYWSCVTITPLYSDQGEHLGFTDITQDFSERRAKEREIRESEERIRLLVDSVKDYAIFILDPNGTIVSWNSGAQRIKGYTEEEIIGKHFSIFYPEELIRIAHPQKELELAIQFGRYEEEGVRKRKDGSEFHANVVITPLYDSDHTLRGFAKVTRDITERKLAEDSLRKAYEELELRVVRRTTELQQAKEAAEAANMAKSTFLANMSHEIRTPLGAVIGFAEMLSNSDQSEEERRECHEAIVRNGKLLVSIIDDILDLSKIEAGHLKIEKSEMALSDLVGQIATIANFQAQEKGLEFTIESEGEIPLSISTDPIRIKQILLNVVGNAIKFTEHGSVKMVVKQVKVKERAKLLFVVTDTGPGISSENSKKLFSPFSQGDTSLTRKFGGTGLGLVLSRRLARALGGNVELTWSAPGKGSTFTVSIGLPSQRKLLFSNKPGDSYTEIQQPPLSSDIDLNGVKILLVDDVNDNRTLIKRYLQSFGADVQCAFNGREGLERSLQEDFDIVLMDLSMPVMDGYEATLELRKKGFKKPIIALSAHAMNEEKQRSAKSGFDGHLTKPIDRTHLVKSVLKLVKP